MTPGSATLETLLESPHFPRLAAAAWERLQAERAARVSFRERLQPHEKGEFIDGQVIMHSPARRIHNTTVARLSALLGAWARRHALGEVQIEKALVETERNDYEPDVCFFAAAQAARFTDAQNVFPPPVFVAEVLSEGTERRDRGVKLRDYAANGVAEYWVVDPERRTVEQFLPGPVPETYAPAVVWRAGRVPSAAVPGFAIEVAALFDDQASTAELRRLLA